MQEGRTAPYYSLNMKSLPAEYLQSDHITELLAAAGVGVWVYTLPERQLVWSRGCKELFFLPPDQPVSYEQFLAAVHPEDRPGLRARMAAALDPAGNGRYEHEYRVVEPGYHGQERWIRSAGQAVFDAGRTAPIRLEGVSSDVTAARQQAAQVERYLREFEFMADAVPDIVWIARPDGGITYLNGRWREYTGQNLAEAQEWGWGAVMHPDEQTATLARWNRALQSGQRFEAEFRLRHQDGTYRWFLGRGLPHRAADGSILKWFGTCTDIDAQKQIQAVLRQREAEFSTLANAIPQLAWMTDATGYILWYNQRWYDYTGTTLEDMRGWGWGKVHHPDHYERVRAKWSAALQREEPWEDTFPLRRHDGQYRWFLSRAYPVRDEQGRVQQWFGTNTDISELRAF
jgi:PAS domain S-box-containing protein